MRAASCTARWAADPVAFCTEALGVTLWPKQAEIMRSLLDHAKVAVRSGHKVGKSKLLACIAIWWWATRPRARVVMTSASDRQVRVVLWREIKAVMRTAPHRFDEKALNEMPSLGLQAHDGREVLGFTSKDAEAMAGVSGDQLLYLIDEASGVAERIFEAIEGNLAGGGRAVLCSNPTQTSGTFFDAFHTKRSFWHGFHVSSEETPNVKERRVVVPGLAVHTWVEEMRRLWGVDSPLYQMRVRGNFPSQAANSVIALAHVAAAKERWGTLQPVGRLEIGVDVARFGDDDSVIRPRRGPCFLKATVLHGFDTVQVAGKVLEVARALRVPGEPKPRVKVDTVGVGGGVADVLRLHLAELELVEVNVAESSNAESTDETPLYVRLRDQLWFQLGEWLRDYGALDDEPELEGELVAPTYSFDTAGRRKVESKDELKKRLGRSPDHADAAALAVYEPPPETIDAPPERLVGGGRWGGMGGRGFG